MASNRQDMAPSRWQANERPEGDRPELSLIISASNLRENIARTLDLVIASIKPLTDFEVLVVVNDAHPGPVTTDVRRYSLEVDWRVALHPLTGSDKAAAIKYGFQNARGRVWGYCDGDLGWQARIDETREMAAAVLNGECDLICADRDQSEWTTVRKLKTNIFRAVGRVMFRHGVIDSQAPMKFLTAELGEVLLEACAFRGWEFDVELLWWTRKFGYRIRPYQVHWSTEGTETALETIVLGLVFMGPGMLANLMVLRLRTWYLQRRMVKRFRRDPAMTGR